VRCLQNSALAEGHATGSWYQLRAGKATVPIGNAHLIPKGFRGFGLNLSVRQYSKGTTGILLRRPGVVSTEVSPCLTLRGRKSRLGLWGALVGLIRDKVAAPTLP
jgi:hypothetical protein